MPSDSSTVRLAVVGSGIMGANHARVASALVGAELVGVVDPERERAEKLAVAFGAEAFSAVDELPPVDAAIVAVPTPLHAPIAHELLAAGVDVLVEKPIAPDVETARRLVD